MYKHILLATDLVEEHFHLCQKAVKIAKQFNAILFLMHVIEPPASLQIAQGLGFAEFDTPIKDDANTVMAMLGEAINIPLEHQFVEIGSIKTHLLEKAKQLNCELIIMGFHTTSNLPAFLDSSAHDIIYNKQIDVLMLQTD